MAFHNLRIVLRLNVPHDGDVHAATIISAQIDHSVYLPDLPELHRYRRYWHPELYDLYLSSLAWETAAHRRRPDGRGGTDGRLSFRLGGDRTVQQIVFCLSDPLDQQCGARRYHRIARAILKLNNLVLCDMTERELLLQRERRGFCPSYAVYTFPLFDSRPNLDRVDDIKLELVPRDPIPANHDVVCSVHYLSEEPWLKLRELSEGHPYLGQWRAYESQ